MPHTATVTSLAAAGAPHTRRAAAVSVPRLRVGRPEMLRSTGLALRHPRKVHLPTTSTWILREFLVDAVNYYLAVPAARESIGTGEGYEHLRRVLWAG